MRARHRTVSECMRHHSIRKWKDIMRFEIRYFFLEVELSQPQKFLSRKIPATLLEGVCGYFSIRVSHKRHSMFRISYIDMYCLCTVIKPVWLNPRRKYLISNLIISFHFLTEWWRTNSNVCLLYTSDAADE